MGSGEWIVPYVAPTYPRPASKVLASQSSVHRLQSNICHHGRRTQVPLSQVGLVAVWRMVGRGSSLEAQHRHLLRLHGGGLVHRLRLRREEYSIALHE